MPNPYNVTGQKTPPQWARLAGWLCLLAGGCYTERDFVDALQAEYCPALFTCYANLEADCGSVQCLYTDEATCADAVAGWYADDAGACSDGERFVPSEASACVDDLARFDCVELTAGRLPASCSAACE